MIRFTTLFFFLILGFIAPAQNQVNIDEKVKCKFLLEKSNGASYVVAEVTCAENWHIGAVIPPEDCVGEPTSLTLDKSKFIQTIGAVIEPNPVIEEKFGIKDAYHKGTFKLKQKIAFTTGAPFTISGKLSFQACDAAGACHRRPPILFKIGLPNKSDVFTEDGPVNAELLDTLERKTLSNTKDGNSNGLSTNNKKSKGTSWWEVFSLSFLSGFMALLMPCVFPMIPMTVSFFTKKATKRKDGIIKASIYGLSIIAIHVALALLVILTGTASLLNEMSTNVWFNLFFFLMLFSFGLSFLGSFEIQLPSKWVNQADTKSSMGGFWGIFFMALVLSLASFSCTGPILGTLLVGIAMDGGSSALLIGMFAFGLAIALPFMLFSIFPSWMQAIPKSGSWLNTVKVFLGFIEIAFAFKFLSAVDQMLQLHFLEREIFIAIELSIFIALTLYLFGKIQLPHDQPVSNLSTGRLMASLLSLAFCIYLSTGLWGGPLKLVNAFFPPDYYAERSISTSTISANTLTNADSDFGEMHAGPHGLMVFKDYQKALKYAQKSNKPLLIDFTGHGCVNCRRMEQNVWSSPGVLQHLKSSVVIVSLYVDEKVSLPKAEQKTIRLNDTEFKIKTVGDKWTAMQIRDYNTSALPYYRMKYPDGKDMPIGAADYQNHTDPAEFKAWLEQGIDAFQRYFSTLKTL